MRERVIIKKLFLQIEDQRDLRIWTEVSQLWHLTQKLKSERKIIATSDATDQQRMIDFQSEYNNLVSLSMSIE